jgi:predicted nucleic acid-binding protein
MLFLDTSALVKRYVAEPESELVIELMAADSVWAASALGLLETQVTLCHLGFGEDDESDLRRRVRSDWERFLVVPLAGPTLERVTDIACEHGLRTLDAIHVSSAAQLPRPLTFLTFDGVQAAAATALGLDLYSG